MNGKSCRFLFRQLFFYPALRDNFDIIKNFILFQFFIVSQLYFCGDELVLRIPENQFVCRQLHRLFGFWITVKIITDDRQSMM